MFDFESILEGGPLTQSAITTVREQARLNNLDVDTFSVWQQFFPPVSVNSIKINEMRVPDNRFVADRREFDADGRKIPVRTPTRVDMEMIPISTYFDYGERDLQLLGESRGADIDRVIQEIGVEIPARVTAHVDAVMRRVEMDTHQVWQTGEIMVRNPDTGSASTVSFEFDAQRYVTDDFSGGNNAYDKLLNHIRIAQRRVQGGVAGALMTQAIRDKVLQDAPTDINGNQIGLQGVQELIQREVSQDFQLIVADYSTAEVFDGQNESGTTNRPYYTDGRLTFLPRGGQVGRMAGAPIIRAAQLNSVDTGGQTQVDIRNVAVFYQVQESGKYMKVETQLNWLPVPFEEFVYVVDTGITS